MLSLSPEIVELLYFESFGAPTTTTPTPTPDPDADPNDTPSTGDTARQQPAYSLPRTAESTLQTSVVISSGETVVLGGTLQDKESTVEEKTPFLGDIPLLGWFFKHKSKTHEPEHLLIFVTAKVIGKRGEFRNVKQD